MPQERTRISAAQGKIRPQLCHAGWNQNGTGARTQPTADLSPTPSASGLSRDNLNNQAQIGLHL